MDTKGILINLLGMMSFYSRKLQKKYPKGSCVYVIQAGSISLYGISKKLASISPAANSLASKWRAHQSVNPFLFGDILISGSTCMVSNHFCSFFKEPPE